MWKNYIKHFIKIVQHKYYVFRECFRCGLYLQGVVHDLSKFHPAEFKQARFYTGGGSPIENEKRQTGYSASWLHHIHSNKHHWEYWYDPTSESIAPIPERYIKEMACDIIGASKAYNGKKYTPDMPIEYVRTSGKHPKAIMNLIMPYLESLLKAK